VIDPSADAPLVVTAGGAGIGLTAAPPAFTFDGLGKPSAGPITFSFLGSPARSFTVEADTGYVHP
jgi:hypothetical protein